MRGAEKFASELAVELAELGVSQWCISLTDDSRSGEHSSWLARSLGRMHKLAVACVAVRKKLQECRPEAVLCHGTSCLKVYLIAEKLVLKKGKPRVHLLKIGMTSPWLVRFRWPRLVIDRFVIQRASSVVVLGPSQERELVDLLGFPECRVKLIPNGRRVPASFVRQSPALPLVLFIGAMEPEKNPMGALRAFMEAKALRPHMIMRMLGAGSQMPAVQRFVDERGLGESVELLGHVDDIWEHLKEASVLLVCSHTEGSPGAIVEAMMASVPVVAWEVGDVGAAITGAPGCMLVPYGDYAALAASLVSQDTEVLGEKTRNALSAHARSLYSIDLVAKQYHDLMFRGHG